MDKRIIKYLKKKVMIDRAKKYFEKIDINCKSCLIFNSKEDMMLDMNDESLSLYVSIRVFERRDVFTMIVDTYSKKGNPFYPKEILMKKEIRYWRMDLIRVIFHIWRKRTDEKKKAAIIIQKTWLKYTYSFDGPGYNRLAKKWYQKM